VSTEPTDEDITANYFTGPNLSDVWLNNEPEKTKAYEAVHAHGIDPKTLPWVMAELLVKTDDPLWMDKNYKRIAEMVGTSEVFVPTPVDPDVPPCPSLPYPFVVGPMVDFPVISGTCGVAFYNRFEEIKVCLFEVHLWAVNPDGQEKCAFMWTVIRPGFRVMEITYKEPMIIPCDSTRNYVCRFAQKAGIKPPWKK
jgi:hypothetical protein